LYIFDINCSRCQEKQQLFEVSNYLFTHCGKEVYTFIHHHPSVLNAVINFLTTVEGKRYRIGKFQEAYRKTHNYSYFAVSCVKCGHIFASDFMGINQNRARENPSCKTYKLQVVFEKGIDFDDIHDNQLGAHWCFSDNGHFCE